MCCLEAAEFSSESVGLLLPLVSLKPVFSEVLLCLVAVLEAFQLPLEPAVGTLHLGHLSDREHKVTHAANSTC